eukprot:3685756-Pleurochrysis_carterae.AAC.1
MQPCAHAAAVAAEHCMCITLPQTAREALRTHAYAIRRCAVRQKAFAQGRRAETSKHRQHARKTSHACRPTTTRTQWRTLTLS